MDPLSPGGDSDAQRALGSTGTADEEVEILNASGELHEGCISVKEEWLEERNGRKKGDVSARGDEWRRRDRVQRLPCVRLFLTNCASLVDYTHCHHGNKCLAVWLPVMYNECGGVFVTK